MRFETAKPVAFVILAGRRRDCERRHWPFPFGGMRKICRTTPLLFAIFVSMITKSFVRNLMARNFGVVGLSVPLVAGVM